MIIDSSIVITGSYNFSANAEERNDENTLILHNVDIAALYLAEFQRLLVDVQ
jgi:phosphatidylserine/phosphatidylglycerophosphate/cardiolipin synthase-like enzyme